MTIRLRPHHLLCLLTYVGRGYTPDFVANYHRIVSRLSDGADIVVVAGPDDICAPLLDEPEPHCHRQSVCDRDARASAALVAHLNQAVQPGSRIKLDPTTLAELRQAFAAGEIRSACDGCEWADLCTSVAATDYDGAVLCLRCSPHPREL